MKKCVNGEYIDLTAEEIAELQAVADNQPTPEPTMEERLEALENTMLELMGVDVNG